MRSITPLVCILSLLIAGLTSTASISCRDETGTAVDWWVIAKMPKMKNSNSSYMRDGTGYLYYDETQGSTMLFPNKPINSSTSSPGYTLTQVYNSSRNTVGYAMYNDESPDGNKTGTLAHSKGVVGYDSTGGFWLVHSVPSFPPPPTGPYSYPDSGTIYGQSMLCISLSLPGINQVGRQLQTNGPYFYTYSMPDSLVHSLQFLYNATHHNATISNPPSNTEQLVSSSGRMVFISLAKAKGFGKDLYASLVAPTLQKSLFVETWIRGLEACNCSVCFPPKCDYVTDNVNYVNFGYGLEYTSTRDHSKWAVSKDKTTLCIGDINRMTSQFKRGGGTVCFQQSQLVSLYYSAAQQNTTCEKCEKFTDIDIDLDVNIELDILV